MLRVRVWDPACQNRPGDPNTVLEDLSTRPQHNNDDYTHHAPNPTNNRCTFNTRVRNLQEALLHTDQIYTRRRWKEWYDNSYYLQLHDNHASIKQSFGDNHDLLQRPNHHDLTDDARMKT